MPPLKQKDDDDRVAKVEPEKWWVTAQDLTKEQRASMTPEQKAERRLTAVHRRLEEAEKRLTSSRRARMTRWLNQWVRGVAFREMADKGDIPSLHRWLREQFVDAVRGAFKGQEVGNYIDHVITREVTAALGVYGRNGADRKANLSAHIQKIVEQEVKKQVMAALTLDINVKGRVFSPAAGQRRVNLGEPDDATSE